ncbi:MAG TPA: hypothetical protein VG733_05850 [Chthoniobacteraceae bacterium]|nr:hypothetical protein [Chthoniobacteraceae bacterium]
MINFGDLFFAGWGATAAGCGAGAGFVSLDSDAASLEDGLLLLITIPPLVKMKAHVSSLAYLLYATRARMDDLAAPKQGF